MKGPTDQLSSGHFHTAVVLEPRAGRWRTGKDVAGRGKILVNLFFVIFILNHILFFFQQVFFPLPRPGTDLRSWGGEKNTLPREKMGGYTVSPTQ